MVVKPEMDTACEIELQLTFDSEIDEKALFLEKNRLQTFVDWPFLSNCLCTPEKMAEAGFYYCPTSNEPDLARCYVCLKELDGWEPTDDPWKEHIEHSKKCPLVVLNKKQSEMTVREFLKLEGERQVIAMKNCGDAQLKEIDDKLEIAKKMIMKL